MPVKLLVVGDSASANVQQWCEGLRGAGALIDVLSFAGHWTPEIPVHSLPSCLDLGKARYHLAVPVARAVARRIQPDVVIGYFVTGYGTIARMIGRRPIVQVPAGSDVFVTSPGSLTHRVAMKNLRAADLIVAFAPHLADAVFRHGADAGRLLVHAQGVDVRSFASPPGASTRIADIVTTRSLEPYYRLDEAIRALKDLHGATLTIVGDGSARGELERLADATGIADRVTFAGRVTQAALPAILHGHRVYLSTCPTDGVSASLLEAMSAGLVPVVVDNAANRYWIDHGVNGLLNDGTSPDIARALDRALGDERLRRSARVLNPQIVRDRGDIHVASRLFVDAFARLAYSSTSRPGGSRPCFP